MNAGLWRSQIRDEGTTGPGVTAGTGMVFDFKRYAIHDGPGIRTTVFFKGCPLDCLWCHNPEGKDPHPVLSFVAQRCLSCGACAKRCPNRAISYSPGAVPETDRDRCTACGACTEICPTEARTILGRRYTVGELLAELERDRVFYEQSGGGATFSGGEPLLQLEFLNACLAACESRGIHTALDTSGYAAREALLAAARHSRLVLYDLKDMDGARHLKNTGVPLEPILANLEALAKEGVPVWIRIPVIPGINDDGKTIHNYVGFLATLDRRYPVYLLPYHEIGREKYQRLGLPYQLDGIKPPSRARMEELTQVFSEAGFEVHIGG